MAKQDPLARVWDIIEHVGVCMLTTRTAAGLRARPLHPRSDRANGLIWFVTDLRSGKEHEIERDCEVGLVFIDPSAKAYLSLTARADVQRDHAKAAEIWKSTDNVWWDGPDDANVSVLRVAPVTAELWDGPASKAVAIFEFAKARLTGVKPELGENRKVMVRMRGRRDKRRAQQTRRALVAGPGR
jgi:general stress protein 26